MLILAGSGETLALVAAQMAVTGIVGTALYRQLKERLVRERPYVAHPGIELGTAPLDRYSFPSGHTLHAVSFTILATAAVPELAPISVTNGITCRDLPRTSGRASCCSRCCWQ